jgi:outer membrane protein assembly factor BamB
MDGMIYLSAAAGSTLIALRGSDGHQLWTYHSSDSQPTATTFFAENGISYLIQHDATVVGIRVSDGQVLWRTQIAALQNQILQTIGFFSLDQGNLVLSSQDPQNLSAMVVYILRASDGHLLWRSPDEPITSRPIALNGILYAWQNNGQLDAWRESDGQYLWGYRAPIGSSIVGHLTQGPPLLFLLDPIGTLSILRSSDGELLWRYP